MSRNPTPPLFLLCVLAGPAVAPLPAASYRLDQGQAFSQVGSNVLLSPDGVWAVYTQDADDASSNELWKVRLDGGAPVRLSNGLIPVGWSAIAVDIAPDSSQVLFTAPQDTPGVLELYRAPLAFDGPAVKVSGGNFALGGARFTPDGSRIVWVEDAPPGGRRIYSRAADGTGVPIPLSAGVAASGSILEFAISPDSARVVFRADHTVDERYELYSVPVAGGSVSRLCGIMVAGSDVNHPQGARPWAITADSTRVVYMADQIVDERRELFLAGIAPPSGTEPVKLNGALAGDVQDFTLSPDAQRVVYLADQQLADRVELYSLPLTGGTAVKLSPTLVSPDDVLPSAVISPSSAWTVFRISRLNSGRTELWSAPTAGPAGSAVDLDSPISAGSEVFQGFKVTPSSAHVVYTGDVELEGRQEVWSVPIDGSAARTKLNPSPLIGDWSSAWLTLSSDGGRVCFQHSYYSPISFSWSQRVYEAPVGGGAVRALSAAYPSDDYLPILYRLQAAPQSRRCVWQVETGTTSSQLWIGDSTLFSDGWESGGFVRWSAKRP